MFAPFLSALGGFLLSMLGTFIGQALLSIGIGFAVFKGVDVGVDFVKVNFLSAVNVLPAPVVQLMALCRVGQCLNMVFSAVLARLAMNGMKNGMVKKMQVK
jgi:hypothetical protein